MRGRSAHLGGRHGDPHLDRLVVTGRDVPVDWRAGGARRGRRDADGPGPGPVAGCPGGERRPARRRFDRRHLVGLRGPGERRLVGGARGRSHGGRRRRAGVREGRRAVPVAGGLRGARRGESLSDLPRAAAGGEPWRGALADPRRVGADDVAASSRGCAGGAAGGRSLRAVAGPARSRGAGCDVSLGRRAGGARRGRRRADGAGPDGLDRGAVGGGRPGGGRADRDHVVGLRGGGERHPRGDGGRRLGPVGQRPVPAACHVRGCRGRWPAAHLPRAAAGGQPQHGALPVAGCVGAHDLAAPPGRRAAAADGHQLLRAVAAAAAGAPGSGRDVPLGRRAGGAR